MQENFKTEFKPMIENLKENYTKGSVKNQKVQKFVPVLDGDLSVKNATKFSAKFLENKICKIKQIQNIPDILNVFLNQLRTF